MTATFDEQTQFVDTAGKPLVGASVYFGVRNTDPVANPISIFSDRDLAMAAANPQLTDANGRVANKVWLLGPYSLQVRNSLDVQVYQALDNGDLTGVAELPQGYFNGLELTINVTDPDHDIDIATGVAQDDTETVDMELVTGLTKRLDAAFAAGTNQGMLDSGSIAALTTYFIFLIQNTTTSVNDVLASISQVSPAFPTGFDVKVLIGTALTDANANISAVYGPAQTISGVTIDEGDTTGVESINQGGTWGYRNLIINGDVRISQRGTDTTIAAANILNPNVYGPDRFLGGGSSDNESRFNVDHVSSDGPVGLPSFFRLDTTTAELSVLATEFAFMAHRLEAQNLQHLLYGNSAAKSVTVSFWLRSTKTGIFCSGLFQHDVSRAYVHELTIATTNTWEKHSFTVPGDANGLINNDNGLGLSVFVTLFSGTDKQTTPDVWAAGSDLATANQVNLADNVNNNIDWTGVQIEVGETATEFEHLPVDVQLARCLRYFERLVPDSVSGEFYQPGGANTTSGLRVVIQYFKKRGAVSVTSTTASTFSAVSSGADTVIATISFGTTGKSATFATMSVSGTPLTIGDTVFLRRSGIDTSFIDVDSEL